MKDRDGRLGPSGEVSSLARKSKYESHVLPNLDRIRDWTQQGASLDEIAGKLHVAPSTLRLYLQKAAQGDERYSAFSDALAQARAVADDEVEASLYKLACGYTVSLAKTFKVRRCAYDPKTGRKVSEFEELVIGHDEMHVAANVQAQEFWLSNRRPDRWKYKPQPAPGDEDDDVGIAIMPGVRIHAEEEDHLEAAAEADRLHGAAGI